MVKHSFQFWFTLIDYETNVASGGAAVSCLGHSDDDVRRAMSEQLNKLAFAHTSFFTNDALEDLSDLLVELAPSELSHMYPLSGGSEAMESAIKLGDESSWKRTLPEAVELTKTSGGNLSIVTVIPDFGMSIVGQFFPKNFEKDMAVKVMESLHDFVKAHIPDDIDARHIVAEGNVYECILNTAKEISADLIVVSSGRDDLKDFLLGPNAARIVRHANCSVLVVRN